MSSTSKKLPCGRPRPSKTAKAKADKAHRPDPKEIWNRLDRFRESQGLNQSQARKRILETILNKTDHFTGVELVRDVQAKHSSIGAATVYRNLPVLVEADILRESLNHLDGQVVYEVDWSDHHDHIVCLDCRNIFEFVDTKIEDRQHKVISDMKFDEVHHKHVVYVKCQYLSQKKK